MTQTGSVAESRLSDWISLGVLASWVPRDAVDDAVEATGKGAKRKGGKLPPHVMVYFAMALALLAEEDYEETWTRLSETLADWGCWDPAQGTVTTGGLTQARQRLGYEPVREVFAQVAVPPATEDTEGAFLGPWRKMSMDGLEWDVPATEPNIAAFGFPGTGKDAAPAAFPKARAGTVGEGAPHAARPFGRGCPGHGAEYRRVRVPRHREGCCPGGVSQGQGGDGRRVRVARGGAGGDRPVRVQGQRRAVPGPHAVPAAGAGLAADGRPELL